MTENKVTIIGPAIIDILAGPIGNKIFEVGSMPMNEIKMSYGGNGYNESYVLKQLGVNVELYSILGNDEAGHKILDKLNNLAINTEHVLIKDDLSTSINIVLFDEKAERRFLTNPFGSQRRMSEEDILDGNMDFGNIVCFSCMFISPLFDIQSMERVFSIIKKKNNRILIVDMTKAKNGESIEQLSPLLSHIDYILPNEEELLLLSGSDIDSGAQDLLNKGVGCVVVKRGARGCTVYTKDRSVDVKAFKSDRLIDSTGAGDCFAAGFIYGLFNKMKLSECAMFANAVVSCCVECVGATEGIISVEEPMIRYEALCASVTEEEHGNR